MPELMIHPLPETVDQQDLAGGVVVVVDVASGDDGEFEGEIVHFTQLLGTAYSKFFKAL